jgi:DNA-binding MarR family transcriptional regulator
VVLAVAEGAARLARLDLKAAGLECLDLITRYGPLSPGDLARRAGLHPATVTGIPDRLERGGWIDSDGADADGQGAGCPGSSAAE